jgi:diguanylate cyclase (GGDEF)-like protein
LLVEGIADKNELSSIAAKLLSDFQHSVVLEDKQVSISASIGISLYPNDGDSIERIIRCADKAMYCAKKSGKNRSQFY